VTSARMLGICGLTASVCAAAGGFMDKPWLLGFGGCVMIVGNLYALLKG
jgi:hypothetical protein